MQSIPVLVTGGAGYIGSHVCKALAHSGFLPVTYDNLVYGHTEAVQWGPLEIGDIRDGRQTADVLARHKVQAVLHFAGYTYVGESVKDPWKYYDNNTMGTLSLLSAMRACQVRTVVFSSTAATYGLPEQQPIAESCPQRPINPYGSSKLMVEQILADFGRAYGFQTAILRYFNACGADPEGDIGEDHDPETHLIPRGLMAVSGESPGLELFGTDYPTPDGTCVRDYIHVSDLAEGHVLALRHILAGNGSIALNLGTGKGTSVRQVIAAVERVTGCQVPVNIAPRRDGDPAELLADPSAARRLLGFSPIHTDLEGIVGTAWRWFQKSPHRQRFREAAPVASVS